MVFLQDVTQKTVVRDARGNTLSCSEETDKNLSAHTDTTVVDSEEENDDAVRGSTDEFSVADTAPSQFI